MSEKFGAFGRSTLHWIRGRAPEKGTTRSELVAGIPGAISSVPDGMAASVLTGVNPVHGLYASMVGPVAGGLSSSTKLMVITTTSASALAAGSAVSVFAEADRSRVLFLLTVLAGALMIVAGVLRLGRYTRFVPHSVMIGFLSGVAANIVLGQLSDFFGAPVTGSTALARAWDLVTHPGRIDLGTTLCGIVALVLLLTLSRTKAAPYSSLIALVIPSVAVTIWGSGSIELVSDVGEIPSGLPTPALPHLTDLTFGVLAGAFAVAALVLIQGAGVSESAPNLDTTRSDANQDFVAQGVGSVVAGLFQGQPVGGSVGQTAINVSSGARGRWAAIFAGLWMAVILVALSGVVGNVVMSTLAAVLIAAAVGSLRTGALRAIMRTGRNSQIGVIVTFLATLFLPVAAAVGVGVALALLMQINQEALDLRVVELIPDPEGRFVEHPAPKQLESRRVVLLDIYGSLYYAGAKTLQVHLPDPAGAVAPAVVLRLRGRAVLGSTSFAVMSDYANRLQAVGGRLYLSGVDEATHRQMQRNRTVERQGVVEVFEATNIVGEASLDAYHAAQAWVDSRE
jgi:SulP family sulfate permease